MRYAEALEPEILNEYLHDVESCIFEAAPPNAKWLAFEAIAKYQLDASADAEAKRKASPCGWPCSTSALDEVRALVHKHIHDVTEQPRRKVAKGRWRNHYNYSPSQGTLACDDAVDDPVLEVLEDQSYFVEDEDVYVDVNAHICSCKSAQRDEYGEYNLAAGDDFEKSLELHEVRVREVLRRWKDDFGPLLLTATVEKVVSMDLELLDDHLKASVRSRPLLTNAEDTKEIMRQIYECVSSDLAEEYTKPDYPKHCSPCFLIDKPGSSVKRLVIHYGKLNKVTKRHSGTLPSLERTLERASACRYKSKLDKRSGFWQFNLTKRAQDLAAFVAPNGTFFK